MISLTVRRLKLYDSPWLYVSLLIMLLGSFTFYTSHLSINHILNEEVAEETERIATYIGAHFDPAEDSEFVVDYQHLKDLDLLREKMGIFKFQFYDSTGRVVFSSDASDVGYLNIDAEFHNEVMQGKRTNNLEQESFSQPQGGLIIHDVMESYYPYMKGSEFMGALEIYFDVTKKSKELMAITHRLYLNFSLATLLLLVLVTGLMRRSHKKTLSEEKAHSDKLADEIIKRKAIEKRLSIKERNLDFMAHHDDLTSLPNRRLYLEQLKRSVDQGMRYHRSFGLLFLDLDNFKDVNDSLGHPVGDQLLQGVVIRLCEVVRGGDFLARIGGDEFTLILDHVDNQQVAEQAAQRFLSVLDEPIELGDIQLKVNASVGVCLFPRDGTSVDDLTKHADSAMYEAKRSCKGGCKLYSPALSDQGERQLRLQNDLEQALDRNEFELYYQPQIDPQSGNICGAEALIRWLHPELGLISPVEFIPIAERSGCILAIGAWVIESAVEKVKSWQEQRGEPLHVAVNLSPRQFRDDSLLEQIRALNESGLEGGFPLELELTESLLMDDTEMALGTLQAFADLGIDIAIDDFGTGYSSFSYLQRFNAHKLKIDRSFISKIDDPCSAVIVETIIDLGKRLGMIIIAEGAEEAYQIDFLKRRGCDLVQGYYYSKPLPVKEFEREWLDIAG